MDWYFYVGLIAAGCIAAFNAPQLIQVFKTKNTCGMSIGMLSLLLIGDLCFVLNGIGILADSGTTEHKISAGLPILLANLVASVMTITLLVAKIKSLYWAKKFSTSEKQYCENYEAYKTKRRMLKASKKAAKQQPSAPVESAPTPETPAPTVPTA